MKPVRLVVIMFVVVFLSLSLTGKQRMDFLLFNLGKGNQSDFLSMSKEFSVAMAPMFYGEAETKGSSGFEIGLGYTLTKINLGANHWKEALYDKPVSMGVPPFYSGGDLHFTKGFGFGLKLFGNLRYFILTEMISGGGGFEYAINEGIKLAPDISIGAGYNRLFGSGDLNLQMIDLRLKLSKTFVANHQVKLIPMVAYSHLFAFASSNRLGGYFDYSNRTDAFVWADETGEPFYFNQEFINIDRIFLGFKTVVGHFGFEVEAVLPINAGKTFTFNAGFSVVL
jgi:hypothetical protein